MEEATTDKKGKKAPPPKKDDKKGAKGAPASTPIEPEEDVKPKQVFPEPEDHVNANIVEFLKHFKSERLIEIQCANPEKDGRKRSDEEKEQILEAAKKQREEECQVQEAIIARRDEMKTTREAFKANQTQKIVSDREAFKSELSQTIEKRNSYREMII